MRSLSAQTRMFWIVTAVAFTLRFVHLWFMRANPLFEQPIMDAGVHDLWARGLLAGTWPGPEPFFRAPLYPYFLAGLYWIFDASRFPVQLVHVLISALGAGLAALSAARIWGRRAGYMAGLLLATLWTSIYFSGELLIVTIPLTLNLLWLWLLLREGETTVVRRLVLVGLVIGLSAIARPNVLIVLPVVVWYVWRVLKPRPLGWLGLVVALALPVIPVTVSNAVRGGDAVLIASQGGVNFFIGNNAESDGRTAIVPGTRPTWQGGFEDAIAMAERAESRELKPSEVDRHFLRRGLTFIVEEPGQAARLFWRKFTMLMGAGERSNNKFIYAWREWSPLLKLPVLAGWPLLLFLGVLGWSRRDGATGSRPLLLGVCIAYCVSILLFFVNARFRLPVAAIMAIPAGAGLDALVTTIRNRRWSLGLIGPAFAVALIAFSLSDFSDFKEHRTDINPFYHFTLGNAYISRGENRNAIRAYNEALAIERRQANRHFGLVRDNLYQALGEALIAEDRRGEALETAGQWVAASPNSLEARLKYGDLLLSSNRMDEAAVQFDIVLRTAPDNVRARLGTAWVLYREGEHGTALRRFETIHRSGENPQALFGAGLCLMTLARDQEAEQAFRGVLRLSPGYWQAYGNLAEIYQRTDRVAEARDAYQRLLRFNPADERARRWLVEHP
jgi:tetratricopeptide (TPR) repeat protein